MPDGRIFCDPAWWPRKISRDRYYGTGKWAPKPKNGVQPPLEAYRTWTAIPEERQPAITPKMWSDAHDAYLAEYQGIVDIRTGPYVVHYGCGGHDRSDKYQSGNLFERRSDIITDMSNAACQLQARADNAAMGVTIDGKDVVEVPAPTGMRHAVAASASGGPGAANLHTRAPVLPGPDGVGLVAGRPRIPEPDYDIPTMDATMQQMVSRLLANKTDKEPTMITLTSLNYKEHDEWLDARQKYLLDVIDYNETHALQILPGRVQAFIDRSLWRTVSQGILPKDVRTKKGEACNTKECTQFFLRTGRYLREGSRIVDTPIAMLTAVAYVKGKAGTTNLQRWVVYIGKFEDVLDKVPMVNRPTDKKLVGVLRHAVKPGDIRRDFARAIDFNMAVGGTHALEPALRGGNKNFAIAKDVMEHIARLIDYNIRCGMYKQTWNDKPDNEEVCLNFLAGRCKKGAKCPRKHTTL